MIFHICTFKVAIKGMVVQPMVQVMAITEAIHKAQVVAKHNQPLKLLTLKLLPLQLLPLKIQPIKLHAHQARFMSPH